MNGISSDNRFSSYIKQNTRSHWRQGRFWFFFDTRHLDKNHALHDEKTFRLITVPSLNIEQKFLALEIARYSFRCDDDKHRQLKSITNSSINFIRFRAYYNCLFNGEDIQDLTEITVARILLSKPCLYIMLTESFWAILIGKVLLERIGIWSIFKNFKKKLLKNEY